MKRLTKASEHKILSSEGSYKKQRKKNKGYYASYKLRMRPWKNCDITNPR